MMHSRHDCYELVDQDPEPGPVTPENVQRHIRRGQNARASAIADWVASLFGIRRVKRRRRRRRRPDGAQRIDRQRLTQRFEAELFVIRASAEVLRDKPDLSAADRERFLRVMLEAEAQLGQVLTDLRTRRIWHADVT